MIIDVILACSLNFCEFDCLFKKVAYEVNMDYKLLKSIVYVESKFNPFAIGNSKHSVFSFVLSPFVQSQVH